MRCSEVFSGFAGISFGLVSGETLGFLIIVIFHTT